MKRLIRVALAICITCTWFAEFALAEELSVKAQVSETEVYQGEPFVLQITVSGSDSPAEPDLSKVKNFKVEPLGGHNTNSESITIINGKMTRDVRKGYVFRYKLTPNRTGHLNVPSITVKAGGGALSTQPIAVNVKKPAETEDFKLRLELSKKKCYVGEPIILTVTWYIAKDVRSFEFNIPVLEDKRFQFDDLEAASIGRKELFRLPVAGEEVTAYKGQKTLEGREYTALSFRKVLIPREAGTIRMSQATVVFEALVGYRRSRDPFDDFFSPSRWGVYKKFVVPSNSLTLEVADVPEQGKPAGFTGHIGKYKIETSAAPTKVNVGDPITLTIKISGPEFLKNIELLPLKGQQNLAKDFKIPDEIAPGKVERDAKIFTQTIRATHAEVKAIPSIELPFFDTETGKYDIARSVPIPITVKETKIVTIRDAEGREIAAAKTELKTWRQGIAYNYEDAGVLDNQDYRLGTLAKNPVWILLLIGPFGIYIMLLIGTVLIRRRTADPDTNKARRAYGEFIRRIKAIRKSDKEPSTFHRDMLAAFREYLGSKLRRPSGAITFHDIRNELVDSGVSEKDLSRLENLFERCEAARYAGETDSSTDLREVIGEAIDIARNIERRLK